MPDCTNVEMRELLPDLLHGRLAPDARREVESHVASCADCMAELDLLRAVLRLQDEPPAVDLARVVAALPRPQAARVGFRPATRWQIAAALTMVTVGGLSVAVARRSDAPARLIVAESTAVAEPAVIAPPESRAPATTPVSPAPSTGAPTGADAPTLTIAGGVSDLADDDLVALLGALDAIDSRPATEPDSLSPIAVSGRMQ